MAKCEISRARNALTLYCVMYVYAIHQRGFRQYAPLYMWWILSRHMRQALDTGTDGCMHDYVVKRLAANCANGQGCT